MQIIRNIQKKIRFLFVCLSHIFDYEYVEKFLIEEKKIVFHKGKLYPEKIIYFIDLSKYECGFFAQYRCILAFLEYADKMKYIPVIKMNTKMYKDKESRENIYNLFFEQPTEVQIKDEKKLKNIIYSDFVHLKFISNKEPVGYVINDEQIKKEAYLKSKYVKYKPSVNESIQREMKILLTGNESNVLGVHIRGGDYFQNWKEHPSVITVKEYIDYIENALKTGEFEKIFIATDDSRCLEFMKNYYNGKVVSYEDVSRSDRDVGIHYTNRSSRIGYEVLRDMYTLSQCGGLIAGNSQVSIVARIEKYSRNEKYRYINIIDKGLN